MKKLKVTGIVLILLLISLFVASCSGGDALNKIILGFTNTTPGSAYFQVTANLYRETEPDTFVKIEKKTGTKGERGELKEIQFDSFIPAGTRVKLVVMIELKKDGLPKYYRAETVWEMTEGVNRPEITDWGTAMNAEDVPESYWSDYL